MHKTHRRSRFSFADISRLTATEEASIAFAEQLRWPDGVACHRCQSVDTVCLSGRPGRYRCRGCARQFSIRTGTPMECSRLPVATWLRALWLILSSSKGISSLKLSEMLGIQQKSAWFLAHRAREMMAWAVHGPISGGIVELDEVYGLGRGPLRHGLDLVAEGPSQEISVVRGKERAQTEVERENIRQWPVGGPGQCRLEATIIAQKEIDRLTSVHPGVISIKGC